MMQEQRAQQKLEKEMSRSKKIKISCSSALSPKSKYSMKRGLALDLSLLFQELYQELIKVCQVPQLKDDQSQKH